MRSQDSSLDNRLDLPRIGSAGLNWSQNRTISTCNAFVKNVLLDSPSLNLAPETGRSGRSRSVRTSSLDWEGGDRFIEHCD
jgi:hypothetical protein